MMNTAWSHLSNAELIDKIIASVNRNRSRPWQHGSIPRTDADYVVWLANHGTIESAGRTVAMHAAHAALSLVEYNDSWRAAIYAVTELIARDDLTVLSPRVLALIQSRELTCNSQ